MQRPLLLLFLVTLFVSPILALADGGLEPPVPVRTVSPKYPTEQKRDGVSGLVTINCVIDEKGNVTETTVLKSTHPAFTEPALEALSKWKFKPAKRDGVAVSIKITIPIQFNVSS